MSIFTVKIGNEITSFAAKFDGANWTAVFPNGHYFSCDAMPTAQEIQSRINAAIKRRGIEKVSKSFLLHPYGGYTSSALNNLLFMHSKSREECANILKVSANTVSRWCVGLDSKRHTDMPLKLWERLNEYLEENMKTNIADYKVIFELNGVIRSPCVKAYSIASAKEAAIKEFGADIVIKSAELCTPAITEYFAMGCEVYAQYDDCSEFFVLKAESKEHAEQKASALNAKLNA